MAKRTHHSDKTPPVTDRPTPCDGSPVGYMERKTLVVDLHAASRGPHWLSGKRKPAKAKKSVAKVELHIGTVPPESDLEANIKFVIDTFRNLTGKESTPEAIEGIRQIFEVKATQSKPAPKRKSKAGRE